MKKLFSMILAIAMVLSLSTFVMAAEPGTGSITINSTYDITNRTFDAYLLFEVTDTYVDSNGKTNYNYVATELLTKAVDAIETTTGWINEDYVKHVAGLTTAAAKGALADAVKVELKAGTYTADTTLTGAGYTAEVTGITYGYYIIIETTANLADGTSPMLFALDTTNAVITLKADKYIFEKTEVNESGAPITVDNDTGYNIGDTVYYELETKYPHIVENETVTATYSFSDEMGVGLTFQDDVKLFVDGVEIVLNGADGAAVYVKTTTGFTLDVDFLQIPGYDEGDDVLVTYSAKVNDKALTTTDALKNEAKLTFSNDPNGNGLTDDVTVKTFDFEIYKMNPQEHPLAGAEFTLQNGQGVYLTFVDGLFTEFSTATTPETAPKLISGADGKIVVAGIKAGDYTLTETKAPEGFNLLQIPIVIRINNDGSMAVKYTTDGQFVDVEADEGDVIIIDVINESGLELPGTGGMGTAMFTFLGTIIMAGAAFVLVINRKRIFNV